MANDKQTTAELSPSVPHTTRIWNYFLGGKDNFAADPVATQRDIRLVGSLTDK